MTAIEVNEELIGKRCKCVFCGLMVTGTIEEIQIGEYSAEVKVRLTNPINGVTNLMKAVGHSPVCMTILAHFGILKHR